MRVRLQVVNQPSGRPDADRVIGISDDIRNNPIAWMFKSSPVGSTIVQTEGDYVRTWTLMEDPS